MGLDLPMTKNQMKIQELQALLETLSARSPRRLWIKWRILMRRNVVVRTLMLCGLLLAVAAGFIMHQVSEVDRRARASDKRAVDVDLARQKFDGEYRLYQQDHDDWQDCLRSVQGRLNFRGFIETIANGVLDVLPNDAGAIAFTDGLYKYRDENYQAIDPATCGEEPQPPEIPAILVQLDVPVTIPSTTTIQGG